EGRSDPRPARANRRRDVGVQPQVPAPEQADPIPAGGDPPAWRDGKFLLFLTDAGSPALDMDQSPFVGLQQHPGTRRRPGHACIRHQTRATARTRELLAWNYPSGTTRPALDVDAKQRCRIAKSELLTFRLGGEVPHEGTDLLVGRPLEGVVGREIQTV